MSMIQRHRPVLSVAILRWPDEEEARRQLARFDHPRLLIVEKGEAIPFVTDRLEDWMFATADEDEVQLRAQALESRAAVLPAERPVIDDADLLWFRGQWVALSPVERRLLGVMLDHFEECVMRQDLVASTHAADSSLNSAIKRLRCRLAGLGLTVNTVRGRGYVLATRPFTTPAIGRLPTLP